MNEVLNLISVSGAFLAVFGLLYLIQRFTIGFIPFFERRLIRWLSIGDALFCISSFLFITFYIDFHGPY